MPSPAHILRSILIDLGLVEMPGLSPTPLPDTDTVSCFVPALPDAYDKAVAISNGSGYDGGREQSTGRRHMHPGVRLIIRHPDHAQGYDLAKSIALALDQKIDTITTKAPEDGLNHYVQTVKRTSDVVDLGEESSSTRRQLWSINARISFQDQEGFLG